MQKYIISLLILMLCACNNGGGGDNYNRHHGINGGININKPGTTLPPSDTNQTQETKSALLELKGRNYADGGYDRGYINNKTNELFIESFVKKNGRWENICEEFNGCIITYQKGQEYLIFHEQLSYYELITCATDNGCDIQYKQNDVFYSYCNEESGCIIPGSQETISLDKFINGKYTSNTVGPVGILKTEVALGSKKENIPLQFSEFGYWASTVKYIDDSGYFAIQGFLAGDKSKEIDMTALTNTNLFTESQTYTGKAFVGISSGYGKDIDNKDGFIASGKAILTTTPQSNQEKNWIDESLLLSFTDAGWYNVHMNSQNKQITFFGTPTIDERFVIASAPTQADNMEIHYYGENSAEIATEAVGTASAWGVEMGDGLMRDIEFSFGVTKD